MKQKGIVFRRLIACALVSLLGCSAMGLGSSQPIQIRATATATERPPFTPRPSDTPWPTFTPVPTIVPVTPGVLDGSDFFDGQCPARSWDKLSGGHETEQGNEDQRPRTGY